MARVGASLLFVLLSLGAVACSSADHAKGAAGEPAGGDDADKSDAGASTSSADGGGPTEGTQTVTQSGTITDFSSMAPVVGATVTAGSQTATTDANGAYSFTLPKGEPYSLTVSANGYATLLEQQTSIAADYDAGPTTLVPMMLASFLTASLAGYDATLGVLSVQVVPTTGCASEDGATLSVSPAGTAEVVYFDGSLPSTALTAVKGGNFPSAVIYNVEPGVPLTVTVTHPTCKQSPFPVTYSGVEYTGKMQTEPGNVTGFARIFLQ